MHAWESFVLPGDLESSEESDTSEDGESERGHHVVADQDQLQDAADHHEAVEAVEQTDKVALRPAEEER